MTNREQKKAAKEFAEYWNGRGYEKGESQPYWLSLLRSVYGIKEPEKYIEFEDQVHIDKSTGFIDGYIKDTHVLIEQKSIDKDLRKAIKQSDGSFKTPKKQAQDYSSALPYSKRPRWIITCNFKEFLIYDMEKPEAEPESILLENLSKEYHKLSVIVDSSKESIEHEITISKQAGEIIGEIYDALRMQYVNPDDEKSLQSLSVLCVRLVFCFYAEDADVFGKHLMFHDYLKQFENNPNHFRSALIDLFEVLNTKEEYRDPYMDSDLAAFPYVNGDLFSDEDFENGKIEIPQLTNEIVTLILDKASASINWAEISPTIFGACFESTLNPETRRKSGMVFTSIENIHKVIDPLFLNDLKAEFEEIRQLKTISIKKKKLEEFCEKLGSLRFLDPACGSGNFLTETFLSLRRLENEAIKILVSDKVEWNESLRIKVSITQFYGIEINDFAVAVAKTALWIAESQMLNETRNSVVHVEDNFLPLTTNANILKSNALRIDWNDVVPASELNYIMGNPPFVGYKWQSQSQKDDLHPLFKNAKNIDYVAGWYAKASEYISKTGISCGFVSTNSITQGEQVTAIWKDLIENKNIHINFAYKSFKWDSEANSKAHVHCVIIGFSNEDKTNKYIFTNDEKIKVSRISPYLTDSDTLFLNRRSRPLCDSEIMISGSEPRDGGYLLLTEFEKTDLIKRYPVFEKYIKRFVSAEDFLNNKYRYCLWFKNTDMKDIKDIKPIIDRLEKCSEFRLNSKQKQAHAMADYPYLFVSERQPDSTYLLIPSVSSENRKYIPIGYVDKDVIVSNTAFTIPNASLYTFGILNSKIHMIWALATSGRLEMRINYSNAIVYNNFPWCNPTDDQKKRIEQTAQSILDCREKYSDYSLAEMYSHNMWSCHDLSNAHKENDRAVMDAYGFSSNMTDNEIFEELKKMYQKLTAQ